ncbi:MAG: DUF2065 domain-containing protein [Desulfohalobiaceae bacterium]|nr:DUF2065 domain-containing protein [Desulfohalobiaceae bacterium]MCF8106844.1 DUF2065 domain-containing protein [Desulfohalobiaceae bacterium]
MSFDFSLLIIALGLALILEGLPYFLFAERMPRILRILLEQPPAALRKIGVVALLLGLGLVYLGRQL